MSSDLQFGAEQQKRALELLEGVAWGDMDLHIRSVEDALRRAVSATARDADRWDEALEGVLYADEFSVSASEVEAMDDSTRLAYVGRLLRSLALCYGVSGGLRDGDPVGQEDPNSPSAILRGLNDITWIPLSSSQGLPRASD